MFFSFRKTIRVIGYDWNTATKLNVCGYYQSIINRPINEELFLNWYYITKGKKSNSPN